MVLNQWWVLSDEMDLIAGPFDWKRDAFEYLTDQFDSVQRSAFKFGWDRLVLTRGGEEIPANLMKHRICTAHGFVPGLSSGVG